MLRRVKQRTREQGLPRPLECAIDCANTRLFVMLIAEAHDLTGNGIEHFVGEDHAVNLFR